MRFLSSSFFQLSAGNARGRHSTGRPDSIASSRRSVISAPSLYASIFFTDVQNPYRTYFCHFEITCQQTDLFQLVQFPLCVDAKDPQKAQRIFQDIIQSCKQTDISSALKAKQAVFHLLCYYFECCPPGSVSFIPQSFDSPLSSAISYVETHLHEQITVQQMAEVAGLSFQLLYKTISNPHGNFSWTVYSAEKNGNCNAAFNFIQICPFPRLQIPSVLITSFIFQIFSKNKPEAPSSYRRLYLCSCLDS